MPACARSRADSRLSPQGWVLTQLLCLSLASPKTRGISWGSEAAVLQQERVVSWFWESRTLDVLGHQLRSSVKASRLLLGIQFAPLLGSMCCPVRTSSWGKRVLQQCCFCCSVPALRG